MNPEKLRGDWGEAFTAEYLRKRGYTVVASQYRCRMGEIDLIARKDGVLCFVEVKTRTNLQMGLPREYVTPAKQRRIKKTAMFYLAAHDLDCPARFDVAEVYTDEGHRTVRLEYLKDAFQ